MIDILVVMVHVWADDPDAPQVKWQEFGRRCATSANLLPWPKIWQFDFVKKDVFSQYQPKIVMKPKWRHSTQTSEDGRVPHPDVIISEQDWMTTSNQQTKMLIDYLDPRLVLVGGLHKDLCVRGVILDIKDHKREYLESDLLSYYWRETLKKVKDYDPAFA